MCMRPAARRTILLPDKIQPGKSPGCQTAGEIPVLDLYCLVEYQFLKQPLRRPCGHKSGLAVSGGDDGTRTRDFRLAKAALSQLSYIPEKN